MTETIVVRRYSLGTDPTQETRKMTLRTEDGSIIVTVPYAPRGISYGGRGRTYTTIDRPGRKPILAVGGIPLLTMSFDLVFASTNPDQSMDELMDGLELLAQSGVRCLVNFGPSEAGLWRMTQMSWASVLRHPTDNSVTQATATIELTEASDSAPRVGPVSGGASTPTGPAKTQTYVVKKGDTLGSIAKKFYGDVRRWRYVADTNKIKNPKQTTKLAAGRKLTIKPLPKTTKKTIFGVTISSTGEIS